MSVTGTIQARLIIGTRPYFIDLSAGITIERTLGMSPNLCAVVIPGNYVRNLPGGFDFGPSTPYIETGMTASILMVDGLPSAPSAPIDPDDPPIMDGSVEFLNLTVHRVYLSQSATAGMRTVVELKDARWRNQRGSITGQYNIPGDAAYVNSLGQLVEGRLRNQRTVKQLVELCFAAMGLSGDDGDYDTTALDDINWYPPVNWDFAVPAAEIERLLAEIGCGVAFLRTGKYKVVVLGDLDGRGVMPPYEGANIPQYTSVEELTGANIYVVGGRIIREEYTEFLEAVGEDVDGTIKPLRNLSYAPTPNVGSYGGFDHITSQWGGFTLTGGVLAKSRLTRPSPPAGEPAYTDEFLIGLAEKSVWRMYRFTAVASGVTPEQLWAMKLPWLPFIVEAETRSGQTVRKEPVVYIQRRLPSGDEPFPEEPYEIAGRDGSDLKHSIDLQTGVITFNERCYLRDFPGVKQARVFVRYAYESATYDNDPGGPWVKAVREVDYYIYPRPINGPSPVYPPGNIPLPYNAHSIIPANATIIRRPELIQYNVTNDQGVESVLNITELDDFAGQIVDAIAEEDVRIAGGDGTFPRILDFDVNGAFRQVVWSLNSQGAHTTVSCNRERTLDRTKFLTYHEKIDRVKYGDAVKATRHLMLAPPRGYDFSPAPGRQGRESPVVSPGQQATRGIVKAGFNATSPSEDIPRFAFVEITLSDAKGRVYSVKKPTAAAAAGGSLGVMVDGCRTGCFDDVILAGQARVKIDPEVAAAVTAGSYLDPKPGAFVATTGTAFLVLEKTTVNGDSIARILLPGQGLRRRWCRVTAASGIATNRWSYSFIEVRARLDTSNVLAVEDIGTTLTGYNIRETFNVAARTLQPSTGVNQGGANYPAGFNVKPIPVGAVCELFVESLVNASGVPTTVYFIGEPSADDGTCV